MASIEGVNNSGSLEVKRYRNAALVSPAIASAGYSLAGWSGEIATGVGGIAADSILFASRSNPTGGKTVSLITLNIHFTISVSGSAAPQNRFLGLYRGSTANPGGGTVLSSHPKLNTADGASELDSVGNSGATRIANTTLLTVNGMIFESAPLLIIPTGNAYALGAVASYSYESDCGYSHPIRFSQGQIIGIKNIQALEANMSFYFGINMTWREE